MTFARLATWDDRDAVTAVQRIALNVDAQFDAASPFSVAVVSARNGEGRSHTAASLAVAYARMGRRCLLVDGDLHAPVLHDWFGLPRSAGLREQLDQAAARLPGAGPEAFEDVGQTVPQVAGLRVVTAGAAVEGSTLALWRPAVFNAVLQQWYRQADVVIVDTPQALRHADAQIVAPQVSTCLLVGRKGLSYLAEMQAVRDQLATAGAHVAGAVMNTRRPRLSLWAALSPRPTPLP